MTIEPARLEDAFLEFYTDDAGPVVGAAAGPRPGGAEP